jgi:hypothetical protein
MGSNPGFEAYQGINSLMKEIFSSRDFNKKVYLISANSIPNYAKILADYKALNLNISLSNDELDKMKDKFKDFKDSILQEQINIQILSQYEEIQNILNSEDDNEIIMVDITFFQKMELNLTNYYDKTVTLIKVKNNFQIKLDDGQHIFEFKQKNNGLFKIFNSNKKEQLLEAYESIKNVLNQIFNADNLEQKNDAKTLPVFLIPTKSIPKFINILTNLDALNPKKYINNQKKEQMCRMFLDYKLEKHIQILYEYDQVKEFINSEDDNEFIFASIKFLKGMEIDLEENFSKSVELNINKNNIEIIFKKAENFFIAKRKKNGLYKLIPNENKEDIEKGEIAEYKKEEEKSKNNYNYTNDISDIVSFLDCLKSITKLKKYFLENENLLFSNEFKGLFSLFFYDFLTTSNLEDCIKKSLEERENFSDHISLINTFYDEMHYELNKKNNKKTEKNYQSDSLQDLIFKCRDDFGNNNKSIISDNFYFEKIDILRCSHCKKILYRLENINKLTFNVEEVRNYKANKCEGFDSINILDCLHYFGHQKNNNPNNCGCGSLDFETISCKLNSPPEILTIILHYKENFNNDIIFDIFPQKDSENLSININFAIFNWGESNMTEIINTNYNLIGFCSYYNINERYCRPFYFGEDQKWYLHDTDEIREVSLKDIEKGNPYFLFYQRISD